MQIDNIFEEKIFAKGITAILGGISLIFLFLIYYNEFVETILDEVDLFWFYLGMFLLFLGITLTFFQLVIRITHEYILVGFGLIKKKIMFENIMDCRVDERSNMRYGGFGIRISRIEGKWVLVYNLLKSPRIVLSLKEGKYKEFVFSTKNPEEIIVIIKKYILSVK